MNDFEKMTLIEKERAKFKRYCSHCGHSMVFPQTSKKSKVICSWCGRYIYKNDFEEFKHNLTSFKSQKKERIS